MGSAAMEVGAGYNGGAVGRNQTLAQRGGDMVWIMVLAAVTLLLAVVAALLWYRVWQRQRQQLARRRDEQGANRENGKNRTLRFSGQP